MQIRIDLEGFQKLEVFLQNTSPTTKQNVKRINCTNKNLSSAQVLHTTLIHLQGLEIGIEVRNCL